MLITLVSEVKENSNTGVGSRCYAKNTALLLSVGLILLFDGQFLLDHRDSRFRSGQVGLWTKSDSVTACDDLEIRGYKLL